MAEYDDLHLENYFRDQNAGVDPPTSAACPYHPEPVPLPSPVPAVISKAINNVTQLLKLVVTENHVVSTCLNVMSLCNVLIN